MSYQFYMTFIESHNDAPLDSLSIDIAKDTKILDDTQSLDSNLQDILSTLYANLKDTYTKHYAYHYLSLQLDSNATILTLHTPYKTQRALMLVLSKPVEQDTIGKKYDNNITQVKLDSKLSKRTITFTNRFRLLNHQANTSSGFSVVLFEDMQ